MRFFSFFLFAACTLAASLAQASTITFNGEVNDQTCEVLINGQSDPTVKLHAVNTSELLEKGTPVRLTPFTLSLIKCATGEGKSQATAVIFSHDSVSKTSDLDNIATDNAAKGVAIRLFQDATGTNKIDFANNSRVSVKINPDKETNPSHTFAAAYVRTNDTELIAGQVKAVVQYSISYL